MCCAGRAQCDASRLLCSTEARWSNPPGSVFQVSNPSVRSDRTGVFRNEGDADRLRREALLADVGAVMSKTGARSCSRKSFHGVRAFANGAARMKHLHRRKPRRRAVVLEVAKKVRSTCAAVGSLRLVTVGAGPMTRLGYPGETPGT